MNLRHIEFVIAAAAERSFSRAAERCHVTQPTLSNGIALLEAEVGTPALRLPRVWTADVAATLAAPIAAVLS